MRTPLYNDSKDNKFFTMIKDNKKEDIIAHFKDYDNKPWEYLDHDKLTILHKSTYYDLTDITLTILSQIEERFKSNKDEALNIISNLINLKRGQQGYVPIHYASYRGNLILIRKFIDYGANYETLNNEGLNVLHLAAQGNQPLSIVYFVEEKGMILNVKDKVGSTPLHWACYIGAENSIDFILSYKIDINSQDNEGLTALHLAVLSDKTRIIRKLIHNGANKEIVNSNKLNCAQFAYQKNKINIYDMLLQKNSMCNMCVINTPLEKLEKNKFNIWFFFIIHIIIESSVLLFLFPITRFLNFDQRNTLALFIYLFIGATLFIVYSLLIISNPGSPKKINKFLINYEKDNIFKFCPNCKVKKSNNTKHCIICNACVDEFDHHCYWVNNCIGKKNYKLFIIFLILVMVNLFMNISISIIAFVNKSHNIDILPPKLPFEMIYNKSTIQIISSIVMLISILFLIPVLLLIAYQMGNKFSTSSNNGKLDSTKKNFNEEEEEEEKLIITTNK